MAQLNSDRVGDFESPGGFVFGIQGWTWGDQRPTSITFYLGCGKECCSLAGEKCVHHGVAKVTDQHGRPIKGFVYDSKPVYMDKLTHEQVIDNLTREFPQLDWQKLACAGWPQLPYERLKELRSIPPTPREELVKILDQKLRGDALRMRKEADDEQAARMEASASSE